ncbi:MAG: KTSC domain-containing protein [Chitinophagales bacterium]
MIHAKNYLKESDPHQPHIKTSSTVSKVTYDDSKKILHVEFHNGKEYEYFNVPPSVYERADDAVSIGKFLIADVYGKYESNKLTS